MGKGLAITQANNAEAPEPREASTCAYRRGARHTYTQNRESISTDYVLLGLRDAQRYTAHERETREPWGLRSSGVPGRLTPLKTNTEGRRLRSRRGG